jgi:hypothetical protein
MVNQIKRNLLTWMLPGILFCTGFSDEHKAFHRPSFWEIDGTLYMHYFEEKIDSLSGPEIYELKDAEGLTIWFGRYIFKDVCISGECKMIRLWLFWDGAGNYLGMELPVGEPLTKSDHTDFDQADYAKLEDILRDKSSLLKGLKQEDLVMVPDTLNPYEVDGYTAATRPGLDQVVVKDAVYTCYTLWHTVYGPVRSYLVETLESRINNGYLDLLFKSQDPSLTSFAIDAVKKSPEHHAVFYPLIAREVLSDNNALAEQALEYFDPSRMVSEAEQLLLCSLIPKADAQKKYGIIWKLQETGNVHESVVLQLLRYSEAGELGVGSLNLVYKLIQPEYLNKNDEMNSILSRFSVHENPYIRNLTARLLGTRN